jgi:hypothetical protein
VRVLSEERPAVVVRVLHREIVPEVFLLISSFTKFGTTHR